MSSMLEIGSGESPTPGFIHHDGRDLPGIDIVCEALDIGSHVNRKFSVVKAAHILEHFPFSKSVSVLSNWRSLLSPGGQIMIDVPNLSWQTKAHADGSISDRECVEFMYGGQDYEYNFHMNGFTVATLTEDLVAAGFVDVVVNVVNQVLVAIATNPH